MTFNLNYMAKILSQVLSCILRLIFMPLSLPLSLLILKPYAFVQKTTYTIEGSMVTVINLLPEENFIIKYLKDIYRKIKFIFTGQLSPPTISPAAVEKAKKEAQRIKRINRSHGTNDLIIFQGYEFLTDQQKTDLAPFKSDSNYNFFHLDTKDGALLDTCEFIEEKNNYIVFCGPAGTNYSYYQKHGKDISEHANANTVFFSYRGFDRSYGLTVTQNDLIADTKAQVKRLLDKGVNQEKITLYGFCLGGNVATLTAAALHKEGIEVKLFNDRSYRSNAKLVKDHIMPNKFNNPLDYLWYVISLVLYSIVWIVLKVSGWQMDAESAWQTIAPKNKTFSVIKDNSNTKVDEFIHWDTSIASLELDKNEVNDRCYSYEKKPKDKQAHELCFKKLFNEKNNNIFESMTSFASDQNDHCSDSPTTTSICNIWE